MRSARHTLRWNDDAEYREKCTARGMIRHSPRPNVVPSWVATNADDVPPVAFAAANASFRSESM